MDHDEETATEATEEPSSSSSSSGPRLDMNGVCQSPSSLLPHHDPASPIILHHASSDESSPTTFSGSGQAPLLSATGGVGERVQTLAAHMYTELQRMLSRMPAEVAESGVSGLMPLIVSVLESLDVALLENQQLQVELELCRDDNDQLVAAFEREKAAKKRVDAKLLESEFSSEEERVALGARMQALDSLTR